MTALVQREYMRAYRQRQIDGTRSTYWNALAPSERLACRTEKTATCWLWTGRTDRRGYGFINYQGHRTRAHRVAWILKNGPIPGGLHVCHRCDNPACVRPSHLFLGTSADNMADMAAKGRHFSRTRPELVLRGEHHGQAKVSAADVATIRAEYRPYRVTYAVLAARFGLHRDSIARIVRGETWSD